MLTMEGSADEGEPKVLVWERAGSRRKRATEAEDQTPLWMPAKEQNTWVDGWITDRKVSCMH